MNTDLSYIVIALFILSLITERIANWLKLALHNPATRATRALAAFFTMSKNPGNLRLKEKTTDLEKRREKKLLVLNILSGTLVAIILKADLIGLFSAMKQANADGMLGWQNFDRTTESLPLVLLGCIATGFFTSFGSRFWHDLLDMLLQVKDYRRALTDKATYNTESVKNLEEAIQYSPAAKVRFAIEQNQQLKAGNPNIIDITLGSVKTGSTRTASADVHLSDANDSKIPDMLKGRLPGGTEFTVPVKKIKNVSAASISASGGDRVATSVFPGYIGTLGCRLKDTRTEQVYALTCCHIVTNGSYVNYTPGSTISGMTINDVATNESTTGDISVQMDTTYDLAWAVLDKPQLPDLSLQPVRAITDDDIMNATPVKFKGAINSNATGIIINTNCTRPVTYTTNNTTVNLTNLILIGKETDDNQYHSISEKGDSGALVLTEKDEPFGILVGDSLQFTYVMPIQAFLKDNNKTIF